MRKNLNILFLLTLLLSSCDGLKMITIETQEPAHVILPQNIRSILVVNNVVTQPEDVGHSMKSLNKSEIEHFLIPMDSVAIFYTEALSQFLNEEQYFDEILYYDKPLRTDTDFWIEKPLMPEEVKRLSNENEVDAIVSLDKLFVTTLLEEKQPKNGYVYIKETTINHSIIRIYTQTSKEEAPTINYVDSVVWVAPADFSVHKSTNRLLDFKNKYLDSNKIKKAFMKDFVVAAAEQISKILSPHWEVQERSFYTLPYELVKEGVSFAEQNKWDEAFVKWEEFFNENKKTINKAKAASNIALAYEMLEDMEQADKWIAISYRLFEESVSPNSFDLRRTLLYKNEIERRYNNEKALNTQSL